MKKFIAKFLLQFKNIYFVSGTFYHENERKWFRVIYIPKSGYVNENELRKIVEVELECSIPKFVITYYKKITHKEAKNF